MKFRRSPKFAEADNPWQRLSDRQTAVAQLRMEGYRNVAIAEILGIERATVSSHLKAICARVGTNKVQAGLDVLRRYPQPDQEKTDARRLPDVGEHGT